MAEASPSTTGGAFGSGAPFTTGRRHTIGGTGSPCIVSSIGRSSAARAAASSVSPA